MSDKFCPECGAKITGKTGFCSECGAPINLEKISDNINEANIKNMADLESKLKIISIVGAISAIFAWIFYDKIIQFGKYSNLMSVPLVILALGCAFYILSKKSKFRIWGIIILWILFTLFGTIAFYPIYMCIFDIIIAVILIIYYFRNN